MSDPAHPTPTYLTLESADVAHSFWIPQLAGKTDLIPNRRNVMWMAPREAGTYLGQCAEFCGTQHAHMLLRVVVHPADDFASLGAGAAQARGANPAGRRGTPGLRGHRLRELPHGAEAPARTAASDPT